MKLERVCIREAAEDGMGFALSRQLRMFRGEVLRQETLIAKRIKLADFFAPKAS